MPIIQVTECVERNLAFVGDDFGPVNFAAPMIDSKRHRVPAVVAHRVKKLVAVRVRLLLANLSRALMSRAEMTRISAPSRRSVNVMCNRRPSSLRPSA